MVVNLPFLVTFQSLGSIIWADFSQSCFDFQQMQQLGGTVRIAGSMAYVGQEPWIINGTARDNILFGKPYDEERFETDLFENLGNAIYYWI